MQCPDRDDVLRSVLALLPRGRAWANHDGGPAAGSVLHGFWEAFATVLQFYVQRLCDLREEMFCQTISETRDIWLAEYGLPDPCDPFPDVCTKVAALGGTRCEYFAEVAARAGWSISCENDVPVCGSMCGAALAGDAHCGNASSLVGLVIAVDLAASPAYTGGTEVVQPLAGLMLAGTPLNCEPSIGPLQCLLDRILPAHLPAIYSAH